MEISVIIPCYLLPDKNSELLRFTQRCLNSFCQHVPDFELIIIDNGSPIGYDYLRSVADICIHNDHNLGFAPAVNQGLKLARGEWLVVSNNDIELLDNWPQVAIDAWTDDAGAISSHLHDHDPQHKAGIEKADWGMMFGALWLTRRDVVGYIGLLDEGYERGMFEDRDYWVRLEQAGRKLYKVGWCNHIGNATWGKLPDQQEIYLKNKGRFETKWNLST